MQKNDLISFFTGQNSSLSIPRNIDVKIWHFERSTSNGSTMKGCASWQYLSDDSYIYAEQGQLKISEHHYPASQTYRYIFFDHRFDIYFSGFQNHLFQSVALQHANHKLHGFAEHLCGRDLYRSNYTLNDDGTFKIHHHVQGHNKHYSSITHYHQ